MSHGGYYIYRLTRIHKVDVKLKCRAIGAVSLLPPAAMTSEARLVTNSLYTTLPLTVISRIFASYCTPCHRLSEKKCRRQGCGSSSPLILGKICKNWRTTAWDMAVLWGWIDISVSMERYETQVQLLREWLQRARDIPLSIVVRPHSRPGAMACGYSTPPNALFELLAKHSFHWKTLDIHAPDQCTEILNTTRGCVPLLESVIINMSGAITKGRSVDFLNDAPKLHHLNFIGAIKLKQNANSWPKLTSLTAHGDSNTVTTLLNGAPNLEHCRIEAVYHLAANDQLQSNPVGTPPILVPQLKSLVISRCTNFNFLSTIEAPSLRRLSIIQGPDPFEFAPIIQFIDRSRCKLRAFGVSNVLPIDVVGLYELLSRLDQLTRLYIGSSKASDFQALTRKIPKTLDPSKLEFQSSLSLSGKANSGIILPNLQILYYDTVDPVRSQEMLEMIKHRWNLGREVEFGLDSGATDGVFAKLKIVRFRKSTVMVLWEPLQNEIANGLEVTYDLPYKGEPFN